MERFRFASANYRVHEAPAVDQGRVLGPRGSRAGGCGLPEQVLCDGRSSELQRCRHRAQWRPRPPGLPEVSSWCGPGHLSAGGELLRAPQVPGLPELEGAAAGRGWWTVGGTRPRGLSIRLLGYPRPVHFLTTNGLFSRGATTLSRRLVAVPSINQHSRPPAPFAGTSFHLAGC